MENILKIISKADNVPIVGMLFLVAFFVSYAIIMARRNDRRKASGEDTVEEHYAKKGKVHSWPYLVRIELLAALAVVIILIVWSILLDAPLEEPANPTTTPNPAKAPWYFLGLQELLVYFDPWIAGVVLPNLIVVGLMAIPYIDPGREGPSGHYGIQERRWGTYIFLFGFLSWMVLILIGTFMRGPGWMWFWPWEHWDPHRIVAETNIDLTDKFFGIRSTGVPGMVIGFMLIAGYFGVAMTVPYVILRTLAFGWLERLGPIRYGTIAFLFWSMIGVSIKIILRLTLHIKYVWVTPWFNI